MNVNTAINGFGREGGSVLNTPKQPSEHRGAFWSALSAACAEKPGSSEMLFGASRNTRSTLSDEQISALAERYNPREMSREEYESFLGDLKILEAITPEDREMMESWFLTGSAPEAGGNLKNRLQSIPAESPEEFEGQELLRGIVDRIDWAVNGRSLMDQAAGSDGKFWLNLRQTILDNAKEKEEQRKEDEEIEMLNMVLDNMTGKDAPGVSAAAGIRLGMNVDQELIKTGVLPTELSALRAFLVTLGGNTAIETVEKPEETDEKVQQVDGTSTERLYTGDENRQDLAEEDLAELARKYDPNNMDREQYDRFLEDLVDLGIVPREMLRPLGYHGGAASGGTVIPFVSEQLTTSDFTPSPAGSDIEGWIQNRLLWKPGITRESARRAGLSKQYDQIMNEEKTLSNISAILADVKRQRYPSVSL